MTKDILTRLMEYRGYLEAQYNWWHGWLGRETGGAFDSQSCDYRAESFRLAKHKLECMFPELHTEDLTQIIDGVHGEEIEPTEKQ